MCPWSFLPLEGVGHESDQQIDHDDGRDGEPGNNQQVRHDRVNQLQILQESGR